MYLYFKRFLDFSFATFLLLLFLPLFIFTALLIYISMGKPIFFKQKRLGKNNVIFMAYKFRSMKNKTPQLISDDSRMTSFGNFIRVSRLDELPQLVNILKGDMSFIGPRPLLPEYLPYYSSEEQKRHIVKPGLSGLSQVNNFNYPEWNVQLKDDVKYAENISFKLDLSIFIKTIQHVFMVKTLASSNKIQRKSLIEYKKIINIKTTTMNLFNKTLNTERVALRELNVNDASDMFDFTSSSEVTQFLEWDPHTSIEQPTVFLKAILEKYKSDETSYTWGIELKSERKLVGVIHIYDFNKKYKRAEISWVLNPKYQGKGLMYESAYAIISFCFKELNFKRIQAKCNVRNKASLKSIERIGMKKEGLMRQFFIINGVYEDALLLSIIDTDFNLKNKDV